MDGYNQGYENVSDIFGPCRNFLCRFLILLPLLTPTITSNWNQKSINLGWSMIIMSFNEYTLSVLTQSNRQSWVRIMFFRHEFSATFFDTSGKWSSDHTWNARLAYCATLPLKDTILKSLLKLLSFSFIPIPISSPYFILWYTTLTPS